MYLVKKPITCLLADAETIAKITNGIDIPKPNATKLSKLVKKLATDVETANNTAKDAGLHGSTIKPKNKPNTEALR